MRQWSTVMDYRCHIGVLPESNGYPNSQTGECEDG